MAENVTLDIMAGRTVMTSKMEDCRKRGRDAWKEQTGMLGRSNNCCNSIALTTLIEKSIHPTHSHHAPTTLSCMGWVGGIGVCDRGRNGMPLFRLLGHIQHEGNAMQE